MCVVKLKIFCVRFLLAGRLFVRNHRTEIIIFCLAFAARLVFFHLIFWRYGEIGFAPPINDDSEGYLRLAINLLRRGVFSISAAEPFAPDAFRTPGYPLFVSIFYGATGAIAAVILAQNIIAGFLAVFIYRLGLKFGKIAGLAAAALFSFDPTGIYWNNQLLSETLFATLLFFAVYFLGKALDDFRYRHLTLAAAFLAASAYIRPVSTYLLPPLAVLLLIFLAIIKKIKFSRALLACLVFFITGAALLAPWYLRNRFLFGVADMSSASGDVGMGKYGAAIRAALPDAPMTEEMKRLAADAVNLKSSNQLLSSEAEKRLAGIYIRKYPLTFIKIISASFIPFFLGDGLQISLSVIFPDLSASRVITDWNGNPVQLLSFLRGRIGLGAAVFWGGKLIWLTITAFMVLGLATALVKKRAFSLTLLFAAVIFYFALGSGIGSYSRFRYPVNPFIFILAGYGFSVFARRKNG
ncbi:glycosyltransferase family 39 protein [Candidatus Uhrbacteria bacterium]|nr:glycosyltransferase family 39 protein [Candidatus Uhrbacteria bacterium]